MDTDQIFKLIDSILPFEACLYYQVLPLSIEGSHLKLGIVDPQDASALDYVRRLLSYMNCSLAIQRISAQDQKSVLSAYLYHNGQQNQKDKAAIPTPNPVVNPEIKPVMAETVKTPVSSEIEPLVAGETLKNKVSAALNKSNPHQVPLPPPPRGDINKEKLGNLKPKSTLSDSGVVSSGIPQQLELQTEHLSSSVEVLATLPPGNLLQELVARVVIGGIGRLYFDRQESEGRILWSQDGKLQSALENLDVSHFQAVIDELKRMTGLPLRPFSEPKQVEIERIYENNHLLLRLRIMPGKFGEEATLQVLRGVALKFYQQQQLSNLSMEALRLAEQLQRKMGEMRERARLASMPLEALPALEKLLKNLDEQLDFLISNYSKNKS